MSFQRWKKRQREFVNEVVRRTEVGGEGGGEEVNEEGEVVVSPVGVS